MDPAAEPRQDLVQRIDALLPQTQCTRCGEPDCSGYARAIAEGAPINRCPPGGTEGVRRLAALTGQPVAPLDPVHGLEGPRLTVWIDEAACIGCTLCIKACPVDAIIGAPKRMHDVVDPWCTGCELCIPACPVDCIHREVATPGRVGWQAWTQAQADVARSRYRRHAERVAREAEQEARRLAARALRSTGAAANPPDDPTSEPAGSVATGQASQVDTDARKRAAIDAALARARALRER